MRMMTMIYFCRLKFIVVCSILLLLLRSFFSEHKSLFDIDKFIESTRLESATALYFCHVLRNTNYSLLKSFGAEQFILAIFSALLSTRSLLIVTGVKRAFLLITSCQPPREFLQNTHSHVGIFFLSALVQFISRAHLFAFSHDEIIIYDTSRIFVFARP
jgi:hypothetical protein